MQRFDAITLCRRPAAVIAVLMGFAGVTAAPPVQAQTIYWGLFQENLPASSPNYPGNCWSQAMISGDAINGVLLVGMLTQDQAQDALNNAINTGVCRNPINDD